MTIQARRDQVPLSVALAPTWGELASAGEPALAVRFVLPGRVVSVPFSRLRWWELSAGEPETLTLHTDHLMVLVEGRGLGPIAGALDLQLLAELRINREFQSDRHAPQVREITVETL